MRLSWYEAFTNRLKDQDVIILFGNIFDRFPGERGAMALRERICSLVPEVFMISASDKDYFHNLDCADENVDAILSNFARDERPRRCCYYFENVPAAFPRVGNWDDRNHWRRHTLLMDAVQKAIGKKHKLIFVFPNEAWIPPQFLEALPGVCRFRIPFPDMVERERHFEHVFQEEGVPAQASGSIPARSKTAKRSAGLTDGLAWLDLEKIGKATAAAAITGEDVAKSIRKFRYGVEQDPWAELRKRPQSLASREITSAGSEPLQGQNDAVDKAMKVIAKACFDVAAITTPDYRKPRGVLFFVGPTGVGKTMLAKKLSEIVFGTAEACIVLDMSEYSQEHSEARLVGAPPGFVGYSEGGQLTSAVRDKPFSVVLFDEIDKAHPSIFKKFLQILDEGRLTDGKGQTCDFSQSLIIFTSNQCSDLRKDGSHCLALTEEGPRAVEEADPRYAGFHRVEMPSRNAEQARLVSYYQEALLEIEPFKRHPEIFNRIGLSNIVPFRHLDDPEIAKKVVKGLIDRTKSLFQDRHSIDVQFVDRENIADAVLRSDGYNLEKMGVRNVKQQFESVVLEPLSAKVLALPAIRKRVFVSAACGASKIEISEVAPAASF